MILIIPLIVRQSVKFRDTLNISDSGWAAIVDKSPQTTHNLWRTLFINNNSMRILIIFDLFWVLFPYLFGIFAASLTRHAYRVPHKVPYRSDTIRAVSDVSDTGPQQSHCKVVRAFNHPRRQILLNRAERSCQARLATSVSWHRRSFAVLQRASLAARAGAVLYRLSASIARLDSAAVHPVKMAGN